MTKKCNRHPSIYFLDEDGNVTDTPLQFISWMENNLYEGSDEEEKPSGLRMLIYQQAANLLRASILKFIDRKKSKNLKSMVLLLQTEVTAHSARLAMSKDLENAYNQYQKYEDMFRGSDEERILENVLASKVDGIEDVNDKISFLRQQAASLRERAKNREFDDNNQIRKLATAYDRLANLELLKSREPQVDAQVETELKDLTATEIYDMYSIALSKGKELNAQGKSNSARLAYGFAQALMRDLDNFDTANVEYNIARSYTRALNDAFTRSFCGRYFTGNKNRCS